MIRTAAALLTFIVIATTSPLGAGEYNSVLNIGDSAPDFKDLPGVDDKPHALADFKDKELVVVFFTCNSCPVSNDYEDRISELARKYGEKVGFVGINVNTIPADRLPKMKERAKDKNYPFPYVSDETQQIGKDYGAAFTPEFFLLNRERQIAFMGGMDDNSDPDLVKHRYLEDAINALLAGKAPETKEAVAIGCRVRYLPARRRKAS